MLSVTGPTGKQLTYDGNGNMTSDGTNAYLWDAQNRLYRILYPSNYFGDFTEFVYDALDRCVKIVEYRNFAATSMKQFVWSDDERREERDGSGNLARRFFARGETISGTSYFFTKDHPGSNREITDASGNVQAQYFFDPYGQAYKLQGSVDADFQFAGYYFHAKSALNLTRTRAYSASIGRWINRDPIEEKGGNNLYTYVNNEPTSKTDPLGLYNGYYNSTKNYAQEAYDDVSQAGPAESAQGQIDAWNAEWDASASGLPGPNGGAQDAYRHCLWSCLMSRHMGAAKAKTIADNHEAAGRRSGQSSADEAMDQCNNDAGRCASEDKNKTCQEKCKELLENGQLCGPGGAKTRF